MEILYLLLIILHFLGLASLVGGWLVQMRAGTERHISPAMLHGVLTLLITGILLVGLASGVDALDRDVDNMRALVKLVVALVIAVLVWVNRRRQTIPDGLYYVVGALAIANVVIAVVW